MILAGILGQVLGTGNGRHRILVLDAVAGNLERGGHVEDLLAMLDRRHPPGGEAAAVARPVDLIQNGHGRIARTNEITVQGVAGAPLNGLIGRQKRLGDHVASENTFAAVGRRAAAKQIDLDPLEGQQVDQGFGLGHACSHPRETRN